jgi:hypothetical protein
MNSWNQLECNTNIDSKICNKSIINFKQNIDDKSYSTLVMQLPRVPKLHDYIKNTKIFNVERDQKYIFSLYIMSPYKNENKKRNYFDVNIYIDKVKVKTLDIASSNKYKHIKLNNIKPKSNKLRIDFEIVSNVNFYNNPSWQRASKVYFKFASIRKSKD